MKIGINFNYEKDNNQENISKLLLVPEVKVGSESYFYDYFVEVDTLEEFDEVLRKLEMVLGTKVEFLILPGNLEIFIQFDNKYE